MAEELQANEGDPSEIGFEENFEDEFDEFEIHQTLDESLQEELKEATNFWFHQSSEERPSKPIYRKDPRSGFKLYNGNKRYDPQNEFEFMGITFCSKDELKAILLKMRIFIQFSYDKVFRVMTKNMIILQEDLRELYFQNYLGYYYEEINKKQHKAQMSQPSITSIDVSTTNRKRYKWNITKDKIENPRYWYKNKGKEILKNKYMVYNIVKRYDDFISRRDLVYLYEHLKYNNNEVKYFFTEIDKMPKRFFFDIYHQHFILDFLFRDIIPENYLNPDRFQRHVLFTYRVFHEEFSRKIGNPRYFSTKVNDDLSIKSDELRAELLRLELEPDLTGVIEYYSQFYQE